MSKASISAQFLEFAEAYLLGASLVNNEMIADSARVSDALGSVVMFNARLAVELFLKGMIVAKRPDAKLHHVLEELDVAYKNLYPSGDFAWKVPFTVQVIGGNVNERRDIVSKAVKERPLDQVFRYPVNRIGEPWQIVENFSPERTMSQLEGIGNDFRRLRSLIQPIGEEDA